jgi:predicted acetyltransferase
VQAGVELIAATEDQQSILGNLFELYAHDFSEFHDVQVGEDGRFGYQNLPLYWSEAGRWPFLVKVDGKLAGFVLVVKRGSEASGDEGTWDMAEFFILRGYRGRGVGCEVAREVWRRFPGAWEVRVMKSNRAACAFWKRVISGFAGELVQSTQFEKGGTIWRMFSFKAGPLE